MSLKYVNSQTPSLYQMGDLVRGTVSFDGLGSDPTALRPGTEVEGVIVNFVNGDVHMLNKGRVQIRASDGRLPWIQAEKVITTAGNREHPKGTVTTKVVHVVHCDGCNRDFTGDTEQDATLDFERHQR